MSEPNESIETTSQSTPRRDASKGPGDRTLIVLVYVVLLLGAATLVVAALTNPEARFAEAMLITGGVGVAVALALAPVAWAMLRPRPSAASLDRRIEAVRMNLERLIEYSALSDDARRVLNRQAERDLLCRAIEDDLRRSEWDAAVTLCDELAGRFGYRAEAEQYRARIEAARETTTKAQLDDAISRLDGLIVQRDWIGAFREAARIQRLFPDSERVEGLRERVVEARTVYKTELERRFLEAARGDDADTALEVLRDLDQYLTAEEAEPLREVAKGVIGRARENLGANFKLAVHDHRWPEARQLGRRIINEFPNSRMATEVRQILERIPTTSEVQSASDGVA